MRIFVLLATILSASICFAADKPAVDPKSATLVEALGEWIGLLEGKDLKAITTRWAAGDDAAKSITHYWEHTQKAHARHVYRNWLGEGSPEKIGDKTQFKVGGHSYQHIHVNWQKTGSGWRIAGVAMCR